MYQVFCHTCFENAFYIYPLLNTLYTTQSSSMTIKFNKFQFTFYRDKLKPTSGNQNQNPIRELELKFKQVNNNYQVNDEDTPTFNFQVLYMDSLMKYWFIM